MAKMRVNGVDTMIATYEQLASLSYEEKLSVLTAGAEVLREALTEAIKTRFRVITGALSESITVRDISKGESPLLIVGATGKHPKSTTGKRRKGKGHYEGTNAEILYLLNYGSDRIDASHVFDDTLEQQSEAMTAAMQAAFDEIITSKGL